ncbi:NAD-dependent epimerase/dehydratase family protein [Gramella jeungdoensis]|uniref:NAD-dependent epimerase/dehydratase family protein n=1 Tax=Gramella jeungdoensis TaxID=708091 RepID=A0ABT0Z3N6_9FLAO|nr:NAD-dependent epimerase/dehydratase family protein [Gramella jeungdoensis]MCM8570347.1 NAD-dependent epimerase/dehydratase family protein [Gramella jeungdoensis]
MINGGENILITGAGGQLGVELTRALVDKYGRDAVLATDINPKTRSRLEFSRFKTLNVLDKTELTNILEQENISRVYHLAAILSANGENDPLNTWDINMRSLLLVLELSRLFRFKLFWPSSIAVFGVDSQLVNTPQNAWAVPGTVYGISKQAGENWCNYYHNKYGVDVRSVRYPGLIGYNSLPGGGTTDYAVDIFHKALCKEKFSCFLSSGRTLPMMYMPDAIRATLELMDAPEDKLSIRTSYNIAGVSFSPSDISDRIKSYFPSFRVEYNPDEREGIARTWPQSIDDSTARSDWNWKPEFHLDDIVSDMIGNLSGTAESRSFFN